MGPQIGLCGMKLRWKIIWGLALTGVVGVIALGYSTQGPRKALE